MIKVAINGFGRIGRNVLRAGYLNNKIEFVAINDLSDARTLSHLLKYDSVHGKFDAKIGVRGNNILVDKKPIKITCLRNPEELPWDELGVDIVIESTGLFRDRENAEKHLKAGAKKVLISAPAKNPDVTIVLGVNEKQYKSREHKIISMASCTTNCLAPMIKVLNDNFGLIQGFMTTVHAYTGDQMILDAVNKDLRRARSAAMSIIPTTSGATKSVGIIFPELKDKLDGMAFRVPTANVSIVDLAAELKNDTSVEEINDAFKKASKTNLKGILSCVDEPLVSVDFNGNPNSSIIDCKLTKVLNNNFVKIASWYDNEWGYSCRMIDVITKVLKKR